jgi:glycosyltransferase involved in cell wall biosynthesis
VKEAMGTASRIIVYNEWTAARVRPYNAAVSVIPSGVDLGLFHPRTESPRNREEVVVIIPGRVKDLHKGREFLARILETMAVRRPSMKFHITGVKPAFQGPNVVDAGWLKPSELPDFYRNGDLALVPSLWPEPQGIVAVEALATGLPLLATRVGGLADLVQEGRNGFLVEPGDIEGAAGLLCRLHDDPALRAQLGRGAREECQARFDWDAIFENHYRNLFEV